MDHVYTFCDTKPFACHTSGVIRPTAVASQQGQKLLQRKKETGGVLNSLLLLYHYAIAVHILLLHNDAEISLVQVNTNGPSRLGGGWGGGGDI
ncbi:hypothetical protein ACJX0J_016793, partial [Zea mays]